MKHEYTPTTFRGPDPTYVVSLKYAAGSRQVKMSPQDIEKAIESIIAAAEQRGAVKALRDYASPENELHMLIWDDGEVPSWQALELANIVKSDILNRANELESADQEGDGGSRHIPQE